MPGRQAKHRTFGKQKLPPALFSVSLLGKAFRGQPPLNGEPSSHPSQLALRRAQQVRTTSSHLDSVSMMIIFKPKASPISGRFALFSTFFA